MSADVFISFASQDAKMATTICKAVEGRGFKCWIATRDILPGENFQISIVRAIRSAKVLLLVFTANSNRSDEMTKELALASQNKLMVVPLRVEDVTPNEAFAYEFATRQWIDMFADWEQAMEQLCTRLSAAVSNEYVDTDTIVLGKVDLTSATTQPAARKSSRRLMNMAAGAVALVVVAAAAIWTLTGKESGNAGAATTLSTEPAPSATAGETASTSASIPAPAPAPAPTTADRPVTEIAPATAKTLVAAIPASTTTAPAVAAPTEAAAPVSNPVEPPRKKRTPKPKSPAVPY